MNTRTEAAKKSKTNASPQQSYQAGGSVAAGGDACPREQMIAEAAYFHAERRGFAPGNEMSDWLQAEADMEGLHQQ